MRVIRLAGRRASAVVAGGDGGATFVGGGAEQISLTGNMKKMKMKRER